MSTEGKTSKKKKVEKEVHMTIGQNEPRGRIFVEFSSEDGRLVIQKSFQDTYYGNKEAQEFSQSIKTLSDLHKYFGIK